MLDTERYWCRNQETWVLVPIFTVRFSDFGYKVMYEGEAVWVVCPGGKEEGDTLSIETFKQ